MSDERIKDIILKAKKLGWIKENPNGYPLMEISEVEKCMSALLDEKYMKQINLWIEEKEKSKQTKTQTLPNCTKCGNALINCTCMSSFLGKKLGDN